MNITTKRFGDIEIAEDHIVTFPAGIPGFEAFKRFVILQPDDYVPFAFMQSVEDGDLSFILTDPFLFEPAYEFDLPEAAKAELGIRSEHDVMVRCVVTARTETITMNLLAPLVINVNAKQGKQIVLHQTGYTTKHVIQPGQLAQSESGG